MRPLRSLRFRRRTPARAELALDKLRLTEDASLVAHSLNIATGGPRLSGFTMESVSTKIGGTVLVERSHEPFTEKTITT